MKSSSPTVDQLALAAVFVSPWLFCQPSSHSSAAGASSARPSLQFSSRQEDKIWPLGGPPLVQPRPLRGVPTTQSPASSAGRGEGRRTIPCFRRMHACRAGEIQCFPLESEMQARLSALSVGHCASPCGVLRELPLNHFSSSGFSCMPSVDGTTSKPAPKGAYEAMARAGT